jgi:hypothetical protein
VVKIAFEEFLIGKRVRLSWVDETSFGSGGNMATDGEVIGTDARIEPDFNQNWQEVLAAGADNRSVQDEVLGPLALPFTLVFSNVDWKFIKYLCYGVADAGSDPYTHTFTLANSIQSFKLEWALRHTTDVVITLTGCFALGGTIAFQKATGEGGEGFVSVSMRCYAQAYSMGSSVTTLAAGNITDNPFQWRHFKLTLNSSEVVEVNNGEITIGTGIDVNDSRYANATLDREIGEPIPKTQRVTSRINVNWKDSTYADFWATEAAISGTNKLEFIRGTNDKIVMTLNNLRFPNVFGATDFEAVTDGDLISKIDSFTSLVATDSIATY